jgi:membrane fusion protein (multidrug efflux system)
MKKSYYFPLIIAVSLVFVLSIFLWKKISPYETTDNAYIRGSITNISSRIEGYVTSVPGTLNTKVKEGDILVKFDEKPFKSKVITAKAELRAAQAKILEIKALIATENLRIDEKKLNKNLAKTKIESAKAKKQSEDSNFIMYKKEKERIKELSEGNNATRSSYEKALAKYEVSLYKVKQFDSDITSANISYKVIQKEITKLGINITKLEAEKQRYKAKAESLEGILETHLLNLDSTNILSPITGIIANRIVEPGVYMKKGWSLMSVVPIHDVWVIANFKETQIKELAVGQDVEIRVDAFSDFHLSGKVLSFSPASASSFSLIPPQNASGNFVKVVQRIPVKISLDIPNELVGKVIPGLSVYVKVIASN